MRYNVTSVEYEPRLVHDHPVVSGITLMDEQGQLRQFSKRDAIDWLTQHVGDELWIQSPTTGIPVPVDIIECRMCSEPYLRSRPDRIEDNNLGSYGTRTASLPLPPPPPMGHPYGVPLAPPSASIPPPLPP